MEESCLKPSSRFMTKITATPVVWYGVCRSVGFILWPAPSASYPLKCYFTANTQLSLFGSCVQHLPSFSPSSPLFPQPCIKPLLFLRAYPPTLCSSLLYPPPIFYNNNRHPSERGLIPDAAKECTDKFHCTTCCSVGVIYLLKPVTRSRNTRSLLFQLKDR